MHKAVRVTGVVLLWLLTALEAFGLGAPGLQKFREVHWERMFVGWGYPAGFSYVVGAIEIAGAICLFIPKLASYAAIVLAVVMASAAATLLLHPRLMGWGTPVVHVVLLSGLAAARWKGRLRRVPG